MMHILCSTDGNYIMPTGVMIKSVSVNNSDVDIVFHVLVDNSVNDIHKSQIKDVVSDNKRHSVKFYDVKTDVFSAYPNIGKAKTYITNATYYRLIVVDILDEDINKVIYLDGDIIVNGSLSDLYNYDIDGFAVAAVTDMDEQKQDYKRLGYSSYLGYFNAGVLLINLKYWRENNVKHEFQDIINNHPERILQHDQDVLNIVFAERKRTLLLKYNFQNGFLFKKERLGIDEEKYRDQLAEGKKNAVIIHYIANFKPWYTECLHPWKDLWFKYLSLTEWAVYKPVKRYTPPLRTKVGNILRLLKLLPPLPKFESPYGE